MPKPRKSHSTEIVFEGGPIRTLHPARPDAEALAVRDDRILAVGSRESVVGAVGGNARRIDLAGRTLIPAFVDHHVHLLNIGISALNARRDEELFLDLTHARSVEEVAERVRKRARDLPPGSWILGKNWSQNAWGMPAMPTHHALTKAAPDHPVLLARIDVHSAWCNLAALEQGGIGPGTPDPEGGIIARLEDGSPSGILLDRACEPVLAQVPKLSDDDIRQAFRYAAEGLCAQGFARVYDAGFLEFPSLLSLGTDQARYLDLLLQEDAAAPLPVDIGLMIMAPSPLAEDVLSDPERYRRLSPRIGVGHLKLHADGALGSRGACLTHPYHDDPDTRGLQRGSKKWLRHWARRAVEADLDVAVHAIGDRANTMVLDVYESLLKLHPDMDPRRLRVEHFTYASEHDMQRAARLGVVLAVQPVFVEPDRNGHIMEELRLGPDNAERAYAFGTLARLGARLAGSTDDYNFVPDAVRNYYAAATRRCTLPDVDAAWHPDQRVLPREESLRLQTRWYLPGGGNPLPGTLVEGQRADLAILSDDPLTVSERDILRLEVHATWTRGRREHDDGSVVERKHYGTVLRRPSRPPLPYPERRK